MRKEEIQTVPVRSKTFHNYNFQNNNLTIPSIKTHNVQNFHKDIKYCQQIHQITNKITKSFIIPIYSNKMKP